jgi:hypothetical protein
MNFDPARAANLMRDELIGAMGRINRGEPFSTTAAELGFTPSELEELFNCLEESI